MARIFLGQYKNYNGGKILFNMRFVCRVQIVDDNNIRLGISDLSIK